MTTPSKCWSFIIVSSSLYFLINSGVIITFCSIIGTVGISNKLHKFSQDSKLSYFKLFRFNILNAAKFTGNLQCGLIDNVCVVKVNEKKISTFDFKTKAGDVAQKGSRFFVRIK